MTGQAFGSPYSIGAEVWPGLSKLAEECGEVLQVIGKILGTGGAPEHWDGSHLPTSLEEEISDVLAAICYVLDHTEIDEERVTARAAAKGELFQSWHDEVRAS